MKYFLSTNCIIVEGFSRNTICDLQNEKFYIIEHDFLKYIRSEIGNPSLSEMNIISELLDKEVLLKLDEQEYLFFPEYSFNFESPCQINNAIIDIKSTSDFSISTIVSQLEDLLCYHIEFRFYDFFNYNIINVVMNQLRTSTIESVDIYLPYQNAISYIDSIIELRLKNPRIHWIYIFSTPTNIDFNRYPKFILFTSQNITSEVHCGKISAFYFNVSIPVFSESKSYNTCLNKKISIDSLGNIKNCPSMSHSYGNIKDTTLREALEHPDFKKYWYIHKDQIEVCKDCEFRYICTDCRAYLEDPDNLYSKPLKCGYNPYTCEWEEWSTNPLKQKAIEYYWMQELVKRETEQPSAELTE